MCLQLGEVHIVNIKNLFLSIAVGTVLCASVPLQAGGGYEHSNKSDRQKSRYQEYARVINVEPLYRSVRVEEPRQQCWEERVPVNDRHYQSNSGRSGRSYTPDILGAVVGAAVGRKFGSGRGQDAATVAGAVLGGSIGRDVRRRRDGYNRGHGDYDTTRYEFVERCETVSDYRTEERVDGYRVEYEYDGRRYWTQTDYDPGNQIAVNVSVRPARQ